MTLYNLPKKFFFFLQRISFDPQVNHVQCTVSRKHSHPLSDFYSFLVYFQTTSGESPLLMKQGIDKAGTRPLFLSLTFTFSTGNLWNLPINIMHVLNYMSSPRNVFIPFSPKIKGWDHREKAFAWPVMKIK